MKWKNQKFGVREPKYQTINCKLNEVKRNVLQFLTWKQKRMNQQTNTRTCNNSIIYKYSFVYHLPLLLIILPFSSCLFQSKENKWMKRTLSKCFCTFRNVPNETKKITTTTTIPTDQLEFLMIACNVIRLISCFSAWNGMAVYSIAWYRHSTLYMKYAWWANIHITYSY